MALGGGMWTSQNKLLPGAYINVISAKRAKAATSDRGVAATAYEADWGVSNKVIEVTSDEFERDAFVLFGYPYEDPKLKNLRELFKHARKAYLYRLDKGGVKATNKYADAKYAGTRGNNITIKISANVDVPSNWDVATFVDGVRVDNQTVNKASELKPNAFVVFKDTTLQAEANVDVPSNWDVATFVDGVRVDNQTVNKASELKPNAFVVFKDTTLQAEAGVPLASGTNGSSITGTEHQAFLKAIEPYYYNSLGCISTDEATKKLYVAFGKRMRDEVGVKFQTVVHNYPAADNEGVISVKNNTTSELVYWVNGANAGCKVEEDLTNATYDGEYEVKTDYTQVELEQALRNGEFVFHMAGQEVHVLEDINTLTTLTETKDEEFKNNDTIRLVDSLAEETANTFNTSYNGKIPNDDDGRVSFWNDHFDKLKYYALKRVIKKPVAEDVVVAEGKDKKSVYLESAITKIHKMSKLYATIKVQ